MGQARRKGTRAETPNTVLATLATLALVYHRLAMPDPTLTGVTLFLAGGGASIFIAARKPFGA
jgi:hypothetical protein